MTSADFNESNFDFSGEQSLVNNPLDLDNVTNHSSSLLTSEIIFVDETVEDYQQLVAQIDADVYRLDSNLDGIEQITEVLSQYEDISGVHLISHGDGGSLTLGATELNQENLNEYSDRLKLWNNSLLDDADFLIYGCNVAEGEAGEDFVRDLGSLIGADIAASNDLTGSKDLGGDWDLEYTTGEIEAANIANEDYQDVLATASLDNGILTYDSGEEENSLNLYISNDELFIQESNTETITADSNLTQVDDSTVKIDLNSVTGISVQTDGGQDSITLDSTFTGFTGSLNLNAGSVTDGDSVVINSNLFTAGGDLSIQAESITIPQNTTISTRQISGTDYLNNASTGDSGNITFDARTITLDGTNLYSHVLDDDTTNTTGDISIYAAEEAISTVVGGFDTFDVDVSLDPLDLGVDIDFDSADDSTATIDLIGANLLGGNVILEADASYDEDDFLSFIDNYSLFIGAAIVDATATVNIDSTSTINATSLTANALTNADAISTPISLGIDIGIAYGSLDATAEVIIDGNVTVDSDLNLSTSSDNTIDVEADVGGYQNVAGAVAISEVNTTSRAQIGTTANIDVGGDLNIDAYTIDQNYTLARSTTGEDGNVGIAASVSLETGFTEALLDSQDTTVAGNITLDANQESGSVPKYTDYYTAGGVAAFANVGTDSTGDLVSDTQFGILGTVLNGAKGLKNLFSSKSNTVSDQTGGASSSFDLGAAVAYASDINNVTARIGDNAVVKSTGGSIDLDATAANRPNVSAGSGVDASDDSSTDTDTTNDDSKFAGSAAVAIGDYNNNTYAYIGDGATVDAQQEIDIRAESLNDYETSWGINLVSPFTDDSLEDDDRFPTFIANVASYLNDNLGLDNYVFDSWSQATAEGADVGIAGAVTWLDLNHISEAFIGDNAQINQDDTLRSDNQTVAVNAESINEAVHLGGNIQVPGGITGNFNKLSIPKPPNTDVGGTDNQSSVGGTVLVVNYDNDTKAKIGDGVKLYADSLEVDADTTAMSISLAASGGEAQKFGFNGTGTWFFVDNDTIAQIHSGADITVGNNAVEGSMASLVVDATDKSDVINMSGGVAVSQNIGIGVSISFNTIDRNTQALIGTLDDETAPTTKKKLIVDGDVDIEAQNEGYIGSFALAAAVSTTETHEQPESMDNYESVSADDSDTSWGIGISGEASINEISDTTNVYISDIDVESSDLVNIQPDINLDAVNISEILAIGGSVAIALADEDNKTSAGLAGSFGKNTINNTTKAYVSNSVINSGNLTVFANNDVEILSINASGAGNFNDKGYALAGSVAINDITNDTFAYINNNSQITASEDVDLTATDSSTILSVAGALQYSGQYGIGASIGFNLTNNTTKAYIEDSDLDATNLNVNATNTNTIHAFAVAAGASHNGMAAEFSLTYNSTKNTTEAYIDNDNSDIETSLSGNLSLSADDNAEIFSLAGVFGFSLLTGATDNYAATIGVSIAINEIENQTKAKIKDGRVVVEGDLELIADSTADIQAYSIAGSGSASFNSSGLVFAGAGAGARNQVNNTIEASINDLDDTNNIDTHVDVAGNTNLTATDNSTITADAGGAAISLAIAGDSWSSSAAVSVGAGIANNEITNTVTAHISDAKVESYLDLDLTAQSNATIDAFALGAAVSGNFSSSGVGVSLAGAGAGTENIIRNNISAYIADGSDAKITFDDNNSVLSLLAQDNSKVVADAGGYALSLKFGNGMANGSASVGVSVADNDIANTVRAYVDDSIVTSTAGIDINATSTSTIDLLSIGAAASGSIGSSGLNVSLSGAGTGVENRIENTIEAFVSNNSTVTDTDGHAINIKATDDSTIVADAGGFAVAVSIGSGFSGGVTAGVATAENIIENTVRAYIDNAVVTAAGDLTVEATATSDIDNLTMAGAVSVAASEGAALSAAGAGTYTHNEISNTIEAFIQNDSDVTSNTGSIIINAKDDSTIESVAVGGSIAVSGSASASFSMAIAGVDVDNDINNQVRAYIGDVTTDTTTVNAANDLNLTATSTLTFNDNYAIAASLAASVAPASAAFSGAGANVLTDTTNTVEAFVRNLTTADAIQADNVVLTATDTPTVKPTVGSGALAASFVGASVSVSLTDTTIDNNVRTYIDNSKITTTNNVTLDATSTPNIESEAVTTSVAAAIGGAGAGGEVDVTIASDVSSYINNNAVVDANNVTVEATQTPTVITDVYGVAVSSIAAVGASVSDLEFNGTTKAYIDKADVITAGNLDVLATATPSFDADATAVAAGVITSGAGNGVTVKDTSSTEAYITNASDIDVTNILTITATAQPKLAGNSLGVSASIGGQIGASEVTVEVSPDIKSYIGSNADLTASDFNLTAQQILPETGIAAEADASASGGAVVASINAANATAKNTASTKANINSKAKLNITNTATVQTDLNSSQDAFADGYNGGIFALGFNNAVAESDTTNQINLASNATINAGTFNVYADGDDYNYAEAVAGGGGIVSGRAAEAITDNISDTQVNINSKITVDIIDIEAEHTADFNGKSDSTNASVVGGSGACNENTVDANVEVNFNSDSDVEALDDFDVAVNNNILQAALSDENAEAASGGVYDGSAVETITTISNTSAINVNDGAILSVGDEDRDTVDNMDFTVLNDVNVTATAKLNNGGLIAKAQADVTVTNDINQAYINIGNADITSTHDINFSTRAIADLEAKSNASAWGLSGVSKGYSLVETDIDNQINLNNGAVVEAENANFWVGEDKYGSTNDIDAAAYTDLWNRSASQMEKSDIGADANITLNNAIDINNGASLATNENINLVATEGNYSATGDGEGTEAFDTDDIIGSVVGLITEGDASNLITNGSTSETVDAGVTVDGSIVAGNNNQQHLTITEENGNFSFDMSDQITEEPAILTEDVTASIDATIADLETERSEYSTDDAQYATLSAEIEFWENEKSKIGDGNITVINLPNISASVGSINVTGNYLAGDGNIEARGNAAIDVTNETDAYLRVNDINISDNYGGELLFNNAAISSNGDLNGDENSNLASFSLTTGTDLGEPEIDILNDSDSILEIKGSLVNRNGSINVTNVSGSIYVTEGEISAKSINIDSGESFFLSDGYLFTVGSSPEALWNDDTNDFIDDSEDDLIHEDGSLKYETSDSYQREDSISNQSTVDSAIDNSTGSLNAESSVFIASEYINIAGDIQSGVSDYDLTIDNNIESIISEFESDLSNSDISSQIYNGKYYLLSGHKNWTDAQAQAEELGGNLVTIDDAEEQAWLYETFDVSSTHRWIGLNDVNEEGNFEWIGGEEVDYTNWASEEPDGHSYSFQSESADYVRMTYDGSWGDYSVGGNAIRGIIELELDSASAHFASEFSSEYDLTNYLSNASGTNISGYYDPLLDTIVIYDLEVQGGYIQLVGNVLSTGNGSIEAMSGFGNINIDNSTNYNLELNELNTGDEGVEGKVVIIDNGSGTPVTTTYAKDGDGNVTKTVDGVETAENLDLYTPQESDPYNWRYIKEQTLYFAAKEVPGSAKQIPSGYKVYGDSIYFLTNSRQDWDDAQDEAASYGGDLVTINNAAENAWVNDTFSSNGDLWIGYSDTTWSIVGSSEGNFIWVSGETPTYTNWNSGEPNNKDNEDFTEMYSDGKWNDEDRTNDNYGVIEIPIDSIDFTVSYVDNTVDPQNPEVYVYSGGLSLLNFIEPVDYPSYKAVTFGTDTFNIFSSSNSRFLQVDEDKNRITGDVYAIYMAAVPSQYDIEVNFFGNDSATVDVTSTQDITLTGDITNRGGDVNLTSTSGAIAVDGEIDIDTNNLTLNSGGAIGDSDNPLKTALDGGKLDATAAGDVYLEETKGDIAVNNVNASGDVNLEAHGDIEADSASSKITGEEINLTSETGSIGSTNNALELDSGSDETGSVTLDAAAEIEVTETAGDLYLASATSNSGYVNISVTNGDLIDYQPEETEDLAARADLLDNVWSDMDLVDEDISTTDTDEAGAASAAAAEAVAAYERSKEAEYQLYWQYRNLTPVYDDDNNLTGYTGDEYDTDYVYSFSDTELTQLQELGYSDSAIATQADLKTEQYHSLHEELATSGLTDDYDPDYTYEATEEIETEITADAVWTVDELTRVVNPGLLLPVSDTEINIEVDNIQANDLTLNVGGGIGKSNGTVAIAVRDNNGDIVSISDDELLYLLTAEPNDVSYLNDLGEEVIDPNNNLDSVYSIVINQVDDLDFEATGELNVTATADAYLGSEADITIENLDLGTNEIRLKSGKGINGADTGTTHVTAGDVVLEAGDNSIGSDTNPIEIDTEVLTARANNDLYINQSSGDLEIDGLYAGDNVNLNVAGEIRDRNNTDDANIRSTEIDADSIDNNAIGSSDNYLDIYLESGGSYNLNTTQDAYINNTNGTGGVELEFVGTSGTLTYSNGIYTITDNTSGTSINLTGFDTFNINFANQNNSFVVESLTSETTLNLYGNASNDNIELSNTLEGMVNIDGGAGTDVLTLNDANDTATNSYTVTETEITGHAVEPITYSNLETIDLQGGTNNNDSLTVINESEATQTITFDNSSIADTSMTDITHSGIETIDYYAESGDNTLDTTNFSSSAIALTLYNDLGDNENTVEINAPTNQANIIVEVAEHTSNLKVANILSSNSSYTLSGTDADKFEIIGTELHFLSTPDFETQSSYQVTVTAGSDAANLTIPITDINEAPSLSLDNSNLAIPENSDNTSSIFIGDVVVTDDALGEEELSLSGNDAELFELVNDTELYLVAGTELDYETQSAFDVSVTADDGTFEVPLDLTVNLIDVNEAPGVSFDYSNTYPNQVLTLDGDGDYFDTNNTAIDLSSVFTMEAWVKTTGTNQGIIGKGGDDAKGTGSKGLYVNKWGNLYFAGDQNGIIYSSSSNKVNDGQWHHVAVVVNNNSGSLYVDGVNATLGETYSSNLADDGDHTIKFGFTNYANNLFSGEIDDVRFWDVALSQAEIETSLASGVTGDEDNLVAYYDFEGDNFDDYTFVDNAAITSDRGTITLSENIDTTNRVKIADIAIADDALGTNNLSILGDDADLFEIDGTELYLKAGTTLDYETNQYVDITVEVDDDTVGSTPDASIDLRIVVSDRDDAPVVSAEVLSNRDSLSEDTDTTERIKIADLTVTDVDSPTDANTLSLSGDDADLFELDGMELYLKAGTTLDYETNSALDVTVEVDDPNLGESFDNSVDVSISIANANEIFALDYELNNQSLVLDGTGDYVETNAAVLDLTQSDFTVEAWIKTSATEQTIITRNDNDSNDSDEQALYLNSAGQVAFGSGKNGSIIGNTAVNDDQWHHVAVVWNRDAEMGHIYVDGVDDTTSTQYTPHLIDSSINTFKIGFPSYSDGRTTNYFSGEIDEIRVWERDLTEIEIYDNFARTTSLSGSEEGLVAYYNFQADVTEGNTVTDISSNDYDATLIDDAHIATDNTLEFDSNGISVAENSADTSSVKIADITMLDDNYSTSDLILTGDDADKFTINGTELQVKSGTTLDYETDAELNLTVEFDSETIDATTEADVSLIDVLELTNTVTELDEETDITDRIKVADFVLAEDALVNNAISLSGDDADDFEVEGLALYLKAGTTLDYEAQAAHNVTVSINNTDGSTVDSVIDFTLNVGDRNDEATDIDFTTNSANFTDNLFLNGDENYIETNAGIVDFSSDFTLETWIQTTATQAQGIITKNDGDNSFEVGERSLLMWSDGRLLYRVRKTNHIHAISGNTSINDGQLHHVAVVWDAAAGEGSIYVDGVYDGGNEYDLSQSDNSGDTVKIGAPNHYLAKNHFTGFLDEVRIWDVARTQEEIAADLSTTLTGAETGLAAYYNDFNSDYTNTTIIDVTGNYNGTAIGYDANLPQITLPENIDTTTSVKLTEFSIVDEDATNTSQVSLTGDNSDRFEIVTTGENAYELHLIAGANIDYETTPELDVNIEINDPDFGDSAEVSQTFNVIVANENEAPSLTVEDIVTELNEDTNTDDRIAVANFDIIDEDDNTTLNTLSISGDDADKFELDNNKLYLVAGTSLDYETETNFNVTVNLDDATFGTGIDDSIDLNIAVNDINEAPSLDITSDSSVTTDVLTLDGGSYADGDYLEIDSDAINLDTDYTFETWIKTTTGNRGIFAIRDDDGSIEGGEKYLAINTDGKLHFSSYTGTLFTWINGNTVVNDGEWHHVALAVEENGVSLYVDGEVDRSGTTSSSNLTYADKEDATFKLGANISNAIYFNGEMRDVRFWNTKRTELEIQNNLNSQLTGTETGLVALYNFSDDDTTKAIDRTGNGNDGTLIDDASKTKVIILAENIDTTSRVKIADVSVSDEDIDSAFLNNTLSLTGDDSDLFELDGTEVYLKAGATLDYATQKSLDLAVQIEDGTYSDSITFDIGISDFNESPVLTVENAITTLSEDTDTSKGFKVADLYIIDDSEAQEITLTGDDAELFEIVDVNRDTFTLDGETDYDSETPAFAVNYVEALIQEESELSQAVKVADIAIVNSFVLDTITLSGDDADKFEIIDDSELYLVAGATLDYETLNSLNAIVEISDGTNSESVSLNLSLSETKTQLKELALVDNANLDYESDTQLDVAVEVSDGTNSDSANFSIAITDVNEAPIVSLENKVTSIQENTDTTSRIKIADIVVTDDDADDNEIAVAGYILGGENTDYQNFEVDGTELYLKAGTTLDYEQQNDYRFNIEVGDSTNTTTVRYDLEVTNIIENSVDLSIVTSIRDGDHWSDGAVISSTRDTTERFKVADLVITGGEGNETFSFSGFYADDFEIDGNEVYVKAGTDITKYWRNEGFVELRISVDGSDTAEWLEMVFLSPEMGISITDSIISGGFPRSRTNYYYNGDSKDFESVDVASGSIQQVFELESYGYADLEIEDVTITGANSDDFQLLANDTENSSEYDFPYLGETPTTVDSGEGVFFTVEFDPSSGGDLSAAIEFTSNDASDNPYIINLTGTGIGSEIDLAQSDTEFTSGDTQDFGILEIDTETSQRTFTITNNGNEALSISNIAITGANADEFNTIFPVSEIAAGATADLTVNFAPSGGGDRTATLTINNNDDDESAFAINLTGNGAIPEINLAQEDTDLPSGTTQDFGSVNVDTGEIQQTITIQNTGSKTLNLGDIKVTGTNATYFILENGSAIANTQIEAGESSDLTITFNPRTAETASAILTINSDDSDEAAYTINLTGTGTESTEVTGSDNNDVIDNDDSSQTVDAGGGDDIVTGNDRGERVTGGDGADQVYGEDGNDRNYGDAGDDVLVGGEGRDFLRGGTDNDLIFGGDDNDYLIGDDGEDYLDGELGSDRLRGGNDSDTFVLRSGDGTDLILDFNVDEDHFELDGLEVSDLTFEDDGFGLIKSGDETLAQVRNVTASQLEEYFTNKYSS